MSLNRWKEKIIVTSSDSSTSTTSGAITANSIGLTENASIGNTLRLYGSNNNFTGLKGSNTSTGVSITLPTALPTTTGQVLSSDTSGNLSFAEVSTSSSSSFSGSNNVGSPSNVTGLVYSSGNFEINVSVNISATTNLTQLMKLSGILSANTGWNLTVVEVSGDQSLVEFTITSGGQIQYTSGNYSGFTSMTISWVTYTTAGSAAVNVNAGVNTTSSVSTTSGILLNVNGATVTDNSTSASGTLSRFSGVYVARPTIAASNTSVTTTNASTVYIAGPVIAGTNETITNNHSLLLGSGNFGMSGSSSGTVSIGVQAAAGTYNFNLPTTAGTSGDILTSGGGGSSAMTWTTPTGTGNVVLSASPTFTGTITAAAANFSGAVSKGSGSFDIQHPLSTDPKDRLVHSFIEGPRCDNIYSGKKQLVNGNVIINLDNECVESENCSMRQGTFAALNKNIRIYLQNNESFDRVKGTINGGILTIICENIMSTDIIDWMVVGERKDDFIKTWDRTNTSGSLITEYIKNLN